MEGTAGTAPSLIPGADAMLALLMARADEEEAATELLQETFPFDSLPLVRRRANLHWPKIACRWRLIMLLLSFMYA
jgi:hypothetical protein